MISKYLNRVIFYRIVDSYNYGFGHPVFLSTRKSNSVAKGNLPYLKTILIALIFIASASGIQAATYYSRANGAWATNATWSTTGYGGVAAANFPKAGDIANIGGGFSVTVGANATCASIIIDAGSVLNPTGTVTISATTGITINGTYTNQSTGAITTPSWICNGTYNHATSAEPLPKGKTTSTWAPTSNLNITGSYKVATQFGNFIGQTFGNVTFNPSAMTATVCMYGDKSGSVTVQGNFTIVNTGTNTLFLRQVGYAFVGELNINGNLTMNAGTLDLHNGGTTPTSSVVNLKGNLTLSCTSTMKQTTTQSGSYVKFNFTGTTAQKVDICSTTSITSQATRPTCAIQFIVASGATIDMGTSVLTGTNNTSFALSAGAGIITANTGGLSTSGATGSIQVSGTRTYSTTANYTYNGTSAQVTGNGLTTANNLTIINTNAAGVTLSNAVNVTGTFNVTTGAHVNMGGFISNASSIVLGGVSKNAGLSYGGTGSGANVIDPTYFLANTGKLNVSLPPPINLSYNSPFSFRLNTAITQQNPTVTGIVDSYSISPALPAGLSFNTTSGAITGTPIANSASTTYTVTATNAAGSTSCQIVISVGNFFYAVASGNWNTGIWAPTSGGAADGQIPVSGDIVFIGEAATNYTVTIPSGYAAACGSLTMGTYSDNTVATLNFADASSSLTVGNDLVMNRPNAAATTVVNVNAGSMTVGGTIKLANADLTPDASSSLVNQVNISTGTVTTKNLHFNGQSAAQSQVVFSGAGTLNISGDVTFGYLLGTLTPSTGKVNFNGTTAQTIPVGMSAVNYNNLTINNTSTAGATLSNAAITATNVTGNLLVGDVSTGSTLDNGGYAITLAGGKTLNVANGSTLKLSGTSTMATAPGGKTFGETSNVNYSGSDQVVSSETYGHLTLSGSGTKTMPSSTTTVAGNFTMEGSASATALASINTAKNFTLGSGTTFNASSFTHTVGGDWTNNGTFTPATSIINFNGAGAGNIGASNFNDVTFSGAGTKTATGALIIGGVVNINNNFSAGVYAHTVAGNWTSSGTFTASTGLINFNGTGSQSIDNGSNSFYDLNITNSGGSCTATNSITSTGTFTTNSDATLDMTTYPLIVSTVNHAGTLLTQNTTATPITTGKTWGGLVNYNGIAAQTAMAGTYNNLTISTTTGGAKASGDITVNGELNLAAPNASATVGALEMVTNYNGYPATDANYNTLPLTTNPIVSYILTMGANATTVGQGDVTGKIYRNSLVANTAYTFGNQYTTYAYTVAPSNVTVTVTIGTAYGQTGVWGDPLSVKRSYEMTPTGGAGGRVAMDLHYLESELNGNTESQLVSGDYDIGPDGAPLGDEHGRSSYDFTNNYIGLSGVPISYFQYNADTHNWRTVFTLHNYYTTHTVWNGSISSSWDVGLNWSNGAPGEAMIAVIPDASSTPNDPILAAGKTIGGIQILLGGVLNLNGQTLTIGGYNFNGWEDQSGLSNYAGSTVILKNTAVGGAILTPIPISGIPNFNNLTIEAPANVTVHQNSHVSISGTFTNGGTFDASTFANTVEYNGAAQTVVSPVDNKYDNLILSGSGTKTLPGTLTVLHDFTLGGTASVADGTSLTILGDNFVNNSTESIGGTVILSGTNQQTISGTAPATFNNLTIDNANGILLGKNETVNGTLTLTNGVISTDVNTLTIGCTGSISGADASKYIEGKLARVYCNELTKDFPIGKGGVYRPMTLTYTTNTSSTVTAEEFESAAMRGTLPPFTSLISPNRYWEVSETGSGQTFNITLDGTGYTIPGVPVILNDFTTPFTSYPATAGGSNYTASGLSHFGNFEIASSIPSSIWIGTISSDWNTPENWDPIKVPESGENVEFATSTNYGSEAVNDLVLDQNRTIGSLTNATTKNMIIPAGKSLIINGTVTTDNDPYRIQIQADAAKTNGSLIFTNPELNSSVYATVQMYSKAEKLATPVTYTIDGVTHSSSYSWQYFGIPVQEVAALPTFYGSAIKIYNESQNLDVRFKKWTNLSNASTLYAFKGYEITQTAPTTLEIQGILNTGDKTLQLTKTVSSTSGSINYGSGQNVFGNSFTAAIDISQIQFPNDVDKTVYLYNTGSFGSWYGTTGTGATGTTPGTYLSIPQNASPVVGEEIPSMQGFLLKVLNPAAGSYAVTIPYNSLTSSAIANTTQQRIKGAAETSGDLSYLTVDVVGANGDDRVWLFSQPGTSHGFDNGWDGEKIIISAGTMLYADEELGNYQVNTVDDLEGSYLSFRAGSDSEYTLQINKTSLSDYPSLYLTDLATSEEVDLSSVQTASYSFTATNTDLFDKRFLLSRISKMSTGTTSLQSSLLKVFSTGKTIKILNQTNENGSYELYDMVGKELQSGVFDARTTTEINTFLSEGVYLVKLKTAGNTQSEKVLLK